MDHCRWDSGYDQRWRCNMIDISSCKASFLPRPYSAGFKTRFFELFSISPDPAFKKPLPTRSAVRLEATRVASLFVCSTRQYDSLPEEQGREDQGEKPEKRASFTKLDAQPGKLTRILWSETGHIKAGIQLVAKKAVKRPELEPETVHEDISITTVFQWKSTRRFTSAEASGTAEAQICFPQDRAHLKMWYHLQLPTFLVVWDFKISVPFLWKFPWIWPSWALLRFPGFWWVRLGQKNAPWSFFFLFSVKKGSTSLRSEGVDKLPEAPTPSGKTLAIELSWFNNAMPDGSGLLSHIPGKQQAAL